MEVVTHFIFLGSKITADSNCNHEIKRYLLLGRKAMTNIDSICLSLIFSKKLYQHSSVESKLLFIRVLMCGCESWTIQKAECWSIGVFELWHWRRLLRVLDSERVPWTARKSNQSVLKKINPEYSLEGVMLKLKFQYFGYLIWRANSLEKTLMLKDWRQKEKGAAENEMIR